MMKRLICLPLLFAVAFPTVAQRATESVEVRVLEIEAVVLDRAGRTVPGLTRGDFEVLVDGKPAEVTNFFAVDRGGLVDAADQPSSAATPAQTAPQRVPSRLVVVIDDLHLRQHSRNRALAALESYVRTAMPESTLVTIVRWNLTMSTALRPTADREALLRAIANLKREPAALLRADMERRQVLLQVDDAALNPTKPGASSQASFAIEAANSYARARLREAQTTLEALSELVTVMSGLEGRKTILYLSEALPQQPGIEVVDYVRHVLGGSTVANFHLEKHAGGKANDAFVFDLSDEIRALSSLANSAGVVFSALDPGGTRADEGTSVEYTTALGTLNAMFIRSNDSAGSRVIAAETGGRFIGNENDLEHAVAVLTNDVNTYYSLGVRPPDRSTVDVRVRVRGRDDLRVLTPRRHAIKSEEEAMASAVRSRLYSREQSNPLEARVAVGAAWPRGERCVAPVKVVIPPAKVAPLPSSEIGVHAIVVDDQGLESSVRSSTHSVKGGEPAAIDLDFGFHPRRYVLSLALTEKLTGETSYLQTEVDATICSR